MKGPPLDCSCGNTATHLTVYTCYQKHLAEKTYCDQCQQLITRTYNENPQVNCQPCGGLTPGIAKTIPLPDNYQPPPTRIITLQEAIQQLNLMTNPNN